MSFPILNSCITTRRHTRFPRRRSTAMSCTHQLRHCSGAPLIYVIMGVCGCGKSTVAELLAQKLSCKFYDADTYHPAENISKMAAGIPLTDEDRQPWLQHLAELLRSHVASDTPAVLACSALKPAYRQLLLTTEHQQASRAAGQAADSDTAAAAAAAARSAATAAATPASSTAGPSSSQHSSIGFVLLNPPPEELLSRLQQRAAAGGHFMPPTLLESQLQQLSYTEDEMYMVFSSSGQAAEVLVEAILAQRAAAEAAANSRRT